MIDIWWLVQPSSVMVLLLVVALPLLWGRLRWMAALCLVTALLIAGLPALLPVNEWLGQGLEGQVARPTTLPPRVDGIIVLGGSVDWPISQGRDGLNVTDAAERMMAAKALAQRYPQARLVLTGIYQDIIPHEFKAEPDPQSLLFGPEFAGRRVTFLGAARSTYEEGLLALEELSPAAGETWILVTSAWHMPRALGVFRTLGWRILPYPVDYRSMGHYDITAEPKVGLELATFDALVREWAALTVYRRTGRIQ